MTLLGSNCLNIFTIKTIKNMSKGNAIALLLMLQWVANCKQKEVLHSKIRVSLLEVKIKQ